MHLKINLVANNISQHKRKTTNSASFKKLKNLNSGVAGLSLGLDSPFFLCISEKLFCLQVTEMVPTRSVTLAPHMLNSSRGQRAPSLMTLEKGKNQRGKHEKPVAGDRRIGYSN